jgi:four helix bundle protein
MPFAEEFEDLIIWQQARAQVNAVYDRFGKCPDYAFRDQIQRTAVSVTNNVAEGLETRQFAKRLSRSIKAFSKSLR